MAASRSGSAFSGSCCACRPTTGVLGVDVEAEAEAEAEEIRPPDQAEPRHSRRPPAPGGPRHVRLQPRRYPRVHSLGAAVPADRRPESWESTSRRRRRRRRRTCRRKRAEAERDEALSACHVSRALARNSFRVQPARHESTVKTAHATNSIRARSRAAPARPDPSAPDRKVVYCHVSRALARNSFRVQPARHEWIRTASGCPETDQDARADMATVKTAHATNSIRARSRAAPARPDPSAPGTAPRPGPSALC
jgi:hypothetical protein